MQELDMHNPVGTPDELEELNLDPRTYFSCSAPSQRNRGCPYHAICTMEFKDKPGQAPENIGVYRHTAQGDALKVMAMPCYRLYMHQRQWRENGDTIQVIAQAGDLIPVHETYEDPRETRTHLGRLVNACKHHEVNRPVEKFPRPKEVLVHRSQTQQVKAEIQRLESEKVRRSIMGEPVNAEGGSKRG